MNRILTLDNIDINQTLPIEAYREKVKILQNKAQAIMHYANKRKRAIVLVFEGWDAAGKGGSIRRLTSHIDPRLYQVESIAAPSELEKKHHYLWRFWIRLPQKGRLVIFDRSWYGRVLVERVEGFATLDEWTRAYEEINQFEMDLFDSGIIILKFWMHISQEEQLKRFNARKDDPLKRWKLTEEDWRNRDKWGQYEDATNEMFHRTYSPNAPWYIIPSNDKYLARASVLEIFCEELSRELKIPNKYL